MAKVISKLTKKRFSYDWERWMNGSAYRAKRGIDFDITPEGFANTLYVRGWRTKRRVTVSIVDENTVEFQFKR